MSLLQRFIVDRAGDLVHVIEQDEADTWMLLDEIEQNWKDCYMWGKLYWGWAYIDTNDTKRPWREGVPPNSVLMAEFIRGA